MTQPPPGAGVVNFHVKNIEACLYITDLDQQTSESLLWELFVRCGPIHTVQVHRDKVSNAHLGSASIEFKSSKDADYATLIMEGIKLYGKPMKVKKSQASTINQTLVDPTVTKYDGLVRLRVANLAPEVTEYDFRSIFGKFGPILRVDLSTDKDSGARLAFGFVTYSSFEVGDDAIAKMNRQYLAGRQITVEYALKNTETGERYGNPTDRLLLAKALENNITIMADVDLSSLNNVGMDGGINGSGASASPFYNTGNPNQGSFGDFNSNNNNNQLGQMANVIPFGHPGQQQQQNQNPNQQPPFPNQGPFPHPGQQQNPSQFPPNMPNMPNNMMPPGGPPPGFFPPNNMGMGMNMGPGGPMNMGPGGPINMMMNQGPPGGPGGPGGPMMNPAQTMNMMNFANMTAQQQQNFLLSLVSGGGSGGGGPGGPGGGPGGMMQMQGPPQHHPGNQNGPPPHPQFGLPPPWVRNPQQYDQWVQQMMNR